jgi:LysR family glycine cleavage system transcriptional activator
MAWSSFLGEHGVTSDARFDGPGYEHFFMLLEAGAAGMGLALIPLFLAQDDVARGRLVQPISQTMRTDGSYDLVHVKSAGALRKVRVFKEWLIKQAEQGNAGQRGA